MKKKNNFRVSAIFATVMLFCAVMFAGCVAETDQEMPAGNGTLTISIKSGDFDVPLTRAVTTNPETENVLTTEETVIALFKSDGTLIKVETPTLVDGKLTLSHTESGNDWLSTAQTIYVVANLTNTVKTALVGLTPGTDTQTTFATAFNTAMTFDEALNANSLAGSHIPMFGSAVISNAGAGNYTATVNVDHMLSKITLNSLGVDFSESPTPNASFQPEQVFLINVPDNVGITAAGAITQADPTKWYIGEVAGATNDGANNNTGANHSLPDYATNYNTAAYGDQFTQKTALGTAALADQTVMSAENPVWLSTATAGSQVAQQYYFYTMPNTTAATDNYKTRLVIRGAFKENSAADATEVYYAVPLAATAGLSTATLDPNKNYKVDVIIKQKGATDAYAALPNDIESTLSTTFAVTNFSDQGTIVGFGGGGYAAGTNATAKVGDYYYSDGTWSSTYDNTKTLVGLVFSTNVSAIDDAAGYTHGYVMALTDCGYDYNAGTPTTTTYKWRQYTAPTSGDKAAGFVNVGSTATQYTDDAGYWAAIKSDLDGLAHTNAIGANFTGYDGTAEGEARFAAITDAGTGEDVYPAAYAAKTYGVAVDKTKCSGWYQPSIGQLYALAYNFAGRTAWPNLTFYNNSKGNSGNYNEYHNCYFASGADVTTTAINNYLTARLVTAAGLTVDQDYQPFIARVAGTSSAVYWSSSDYSAFYGVALYFHSNGDLYFNCGNKTNQFYVRPVLAF